MTVSSFAVLMMLTEAFLTADLAYPPTCCHLLHSREWGCGNLQGVGGRHSRRGRGLSQQRASTVITATNQGFHCKRCSRLAFLISLKIDLTVNLGLDRGALQFYETIDSFFPCASKIFEEHICSILVFIFVQAGISKTQHLSRFSY